MIRTAAGACGETGAADDRPPRDHRAERRADGLADPPVADRPGSSSHRRCRPTRRAAVPFSTDDRRWMHQERHNMNMRTLARMLVTGLLLSGTAVSGAQSAEAASVYNVFMVTDGLTHTVVINVSQTKWSGCTDKTFAGSLDFQYVATNTAFKVSRVRAYNSTTSKVPMVASRETVRTTTTTVYDGIPTTSPVDILPGTGATYVVWSSTQKKWVNQVWPSIQWTGSPQASFEFQKNDPTGGTLLCNGVVAVSFFMK
jgi:hypothetical protein